MHGPAYFKNQFVSHVPCACRKRSLSLSKWPIATADCKKKRIIEIVGQFWCVVNVPVSAAAVSRPLEPLLADRFFAALSEAIEDVYAMIRRGRNGQGSLLCSTPLQSRAGTSPGSPHIRTLPPRP